VTVEVKEGGLPNQDDEDKMNNEEGEQVGEQNKTLST
jgi:hypothetical protein